MTRYLSSLQFYAEEHYSEIVPQIVDADFLQMVEPLRCSAYT